MDLDDEELKATRRMNGSDKNVACMEEDMKKIDSFIAIMKSDFRTGLYYKDKLEAIEHLIEAYKEEKEENKRLKCKIDICDWQEKSCKNIIDERYIPVSLVKEKIEEIDKEIEYQKLYGNVSKREELETKKEHFLELLEGE